MVDARTAAVEGNLVSFFDGFDGLVGVQREPWVDVTAFFTDVAFPLFNPISTAHFAPGTVRERTAAVVAAYEARGLPYLWWITPSYGGSELADLLQEAGLHREDIPGMHRDLTTPLEAPLPDGAVLHRVELASEPDPFVATMLAGFGMPEGLGEPMRRILRQFPAAPMVNVLAELDGVPVATATGWIDGDTVGVYNVATVEEVRGRGLGAAVTAAVVEAGRERGATSAVLHSSEAGLPVYQRLGFTTVCTVPQLLGMPS